jgi:drug/metabolite transporter (DMT)-like permease
MWTGLAVYTGQAAGLATSVLWTATSLLFTAAGKRIGPVVVNATRILFALVLLGATHRLYFGIWVPDVVAGQVAFLAVSGVVGLSIGDLALFTSFVDIGPRLAMLVMTTAPLFAALFGWLALGETLHGLAWLGMMLTIGGVAWVVLERPRTQVGLHLPHRVRGLILAFVAAACQAGGLWLSKQGMGHGWLPEHERLDPLAATFLRMVFAAVGMLPILVLHARRERKRRAVGMSPKRIGSRRAGLIFSFCGAVTGPFLGVWMSLVASDRTTLGVAQTLCSLPPVFILPFAIAIHKEHVSPRAVIGAVLTVTGVALLFVQP